jgi:hypothetical protein
MKVRMKIDPYPLASNPQLESWERMFLSGDPAAPALAGIRKSEIADKLELYEKHFSDEYVHVVNLATELVKLPRRAWPYRLIFRLCGFVDKEDFLIKGFQAAGNALKIARMELKDLAIAHATELNRQNAEVIKGDFYKQYTELAGNMNDFHHFLMDNYPRETREAMEQHRTLFDIGKSIIIEQRKKITG